MAEFSAFPSLSVNVPQPANILDMAGKAAQLHQTLLQNTGLGLDQHFKRLGALAKGAMDLLNPDGSIDPGSLQDYIKNQTVLGNIMPDEATKLYLSVPNDPMKAGSVMRQLVGGVADSLAAITPHMGYQSTGDGSIPVQDNAFASGGSNMPSVHNGLSADAANSPVMVTNSDGSTMQLTARDAATYLGGHPGSTATNINGKTVTFDSSGFTQFGPKPATPAGFTPEGAAAAITAAAPPVGGNALTGQAPNALVPATGAAPAAPVAQPTGGPITTAAQAPALRTQATTFIADDIKAGTDPSIASSLGNIQGIGAASDDAVTSAGAGWRASAEKALGLFNIVSDAGASNKEIFDKETGMLASAIGANGGSGTDAAMMQQLRITPNSEMTPLAIKTTAAMVGGLLQWKIDLASAATAWNANGGKVDEYAAFRADFIANHPSPIVLAIGNMPGSQQRSLLKFAATLPADQMDKFVAQYKAAYPNGLGK